MTDTTAAAGVRRAAPGAALADPRRREADRGPYELPGPQRRAKTRKAERGYYAPVFQGAPSTTRQSSVLNTALIGPVTGTAGVANGRDMLSHSLITHDPVTAYNSTPRMISSPNSIVCGGDSMSAPAVFVCRSPYGHIWQPFPN